MKTALLLLITVLFTTMAFGQGRWVDHKSQIALPSLNVRDVLVDSHGNKWFATDKGLTKFDGNDWITFTTTYQGLRSNDIYALAEGLDGKIWILTSHDIESFNGTTWDYHDVSSGLLSSTTGAFGYLSLHVTPDGTVWAGAKEGISGFNGTVWQNFTSENGISLKNVADIEHDDEGNVWFSLHKGYNDTYLPGLVKKSGTTWQFYKPGSANSQNTYFKLNRIDGTVWAAQYGQLYKYESDKFSQIIVDFAALGSSELNISGEITQDESGTVWIAREYNPGFPNGFIKYDGSSWSTVDTGFNVSTIKAEGSYLWCAANKNIYAATGNGVFKIKTDTNAWAQIKNKVGIAENNIFSVFPDNAGNVWIGSGGGVERFDGNNWIRGEHTTDNSIFDIFEDKRGAIWAIGRHTGSVHVRYGNQTILYNYTNSLLPQNQTIHDATIDKDGNIYFSVYDYSNSTGKLIMYDGSKWFDLTSQHTDLKDKINLIYASNDGRVWFFGSNSTLIKSGKEWQRDEMVPLKPISAIADKEGNLWLGYEQSPKLLKYAAGILTEYDLSVLAGTSMYHSITSITIDSQDNLWVGGYFQSPGPEPEQYPGLARFDGTSWKAFSKSDGLVSDAVNAINADNRGNVWIGTQYNGVSQLILFSEKVTVYTSNITCHGGNDGSITFSPGGGKYPYQYSIDGGRTFAADSIFEALYAADYHVIVKDAEGLTAHDEVIKLTQPAGEFTWKVSPVSCAGANDGAIDISFQQNGAEATYHWYDANNNLLATTQNLNGLAGGTYKVVLGFGPCTVTREFIIAEPKPLQGTLTVLNSCGEGSNGQIRIIVTGGSGALKYTIDGGSTYQTDAAFINLAPGMYSVTIQDSKGCTLTMEAAVLKKEIPVPVIAAEKNLTLCAGNSIWLKTQQEYETYKWYNEAGSLLSTADSLQVTGAGTFYVTVSQNGCQAQSSGVSTTVTSTYNLQSICIVTVDAATGKNKVVWGRTENKNIASYNVYKETGSNQYSLLGNVAFNAGNFFIDEASDPMKASERYSISIIDSCGVESIKSPAHKTIYLQASLGVNNSVHLNWGNYEGFNYTQVNILRGTDLNSLQLLATRPANNNTFTDTNPNTTELVYVIEAVTGYSCEITAGGRVSNSFAVTHSNPSAARGPLGVTNENEINSNLLVYPNPANPDITVEFKNGKLISSVRLFDLSGREVQVNKAQVNKASLHFKPETKPGFYIIEVKDVQGQTYRRRVVIL